MFLFMRLFVFLCGYVPYAIAIEPESEEMSPIYETVGECQFNESIRPYLFTSNNLFLVKVSKINTVKDSKDKEIELEIVKDVLSPNLKRKKSRLLLLWPVGAENTNHKQQHKGKVIRELPTLSEEFLLPTAFTEEFSKNPIPVNFKECLLKNNTKNIEGWKTLRNRELVSYSKKNCREMGKFQNWIRKLKIKVVSRHGDGEIFTEKDHDFIEFISQNGKQNSFFDYYTDGDNTKNEDLIDINCKNDYLTLKTQHYESMPFKSLYSLFTGEVILSGGEFQNFEKSGFFIVHTTKRKGQDLGEYPVSNTVEVHMFDKNKFSKIWESPALKKFKYTNAVEKDKMQSLEFKLIEFQGGENEEAVVELNRSDVNCTKNPKPKCILR